MISPEDIATHKIESTFAQWKELALKSLKGKPLEKYLDVSSLEGISKSILFEHSDRAVDLLTYPDTQERVQFYDLKKYSKDHFELDKELGINKFIFQVQKEKIDLSYLPTQNTHLHVQLSNDEFIKNYLGEDIAKNIAIDVNDLIFKDFSNEIDRVLKLNAKTKFLIDLSHVHNAGGSVVQELTYALCLYARLLEKEISPSLIEFRVSTHSELFLNIAKLKTLRYLAELICEQAGSELNITIHATNSLREQTLYDPWNNILRNCTSTLAQVMGGANSVSTRSYDYLFSKLTFEKPSLLAHRYAIQTLNILFEESNIEKTNDPAKGAFYIEKLIENLASASWESFLNWRERSFLENTKDFAIEVAAIGKQRRKEVRTRKKVITGVNDYADPTQRIEDLYKKKWKPIEMQFGHFPLRRLAFEFENLRINNELSEKKEKVVIITRGKLAQINARLNFIQNIFDTVALDYDVINEADINEKIKNDLNKYSAIVFCAIDDEYADFISTIEHPNKVIAGKVDSLKDKTQFLHMGMDVYSFVSQFIKEVE